MPKKPKDGNGKQRPPKPKGRPKEVVTPEVAILLEALQAKGASSGADCQDRLILMGHYVSEKCLNQWVDQYRKAMTAKAIVTSTERVANRREVRNEDWADNPADVVIVDCTTTLSSLPFDMLLLVEDMLRGRRTPRVIRACLASFGYDTTDEAINDYATERADMLTPVDAAGRLMAAAETLEAQTRIIREQAIRVWRNMPARAKNDVKTYVALAKLSIDGQRALIEALKIVPKDDDSTDVTAALQAIEAKLGIEKPAITEASPEVVEA